MERPGWQRVTLEVAAIDAERASALLGAVSGAPVALDQREGSDRVAASVYLRRAKDLTSIGKRLRAEIASRRRAGLLGAAAVRQTSVVEQDWANEWKRHFKPMELAAGMYVAPSWQPAFEPPRGADTLLLDPGMAFGTGRHATTRLAAGLMLQYLKKGEVVIDAGCGSGILALAAAKRGARAYAFDEDPVALRTARVNFAANALRAAALVKADTTPPRFPRANIVVANITAEVLQALAARFASKLRRGGMLVSSGITSRGRLATLASYAQAGLEFVAERRRGEWFAYLHVKP
jgi:ribosomal protein L11 methyltransferase